MSEPKNINQKVKIRGNKNIVAARDVIIYPPSAADQQLRNDLSTLYNNVETAWIKGVLEKSVRRMGMLELGTEIRSDAVHSPIQLEGPDDPVKKSIKEIFEEATRLLLILGDPGSGKTITLLQLARDLLAEVDKKFKRPLPVIMNLSTWTNKNQALDEWLIGELNSPMYRLPEQQGRAWLKDGRILPLLDGLDEVKAEYRAECVAKINEYTSNYGLRGLVVCSRLREYADLGVRLEFNRAIYLQPLRAEQIDKYLAQAGNSLTSLRATLQADKALKNLAQSPLILNIMALAYQDISAKGLSDPTLKTDESRRKHLFDAYIARMFNRKVGTRPYSDEQTKERLSWLAQNMRKHSQEVFVIESLQPSWLQSRRWRWIYYFTSRLVGGLLFGLSAGLIDVWFESTERIWFDILMTGVVAGLLACLLDFLRLIYLSLGKGDNEISPSDEGPNSFIITVEACIAVLAGLFAWAYLDLGQAGIIGGWLGGAFVIARNHDRDLEDDIQPVEALGWYWRKAAKYGLIAALITGVLSGGYEGMSGNLRNGLFWGLVFAFFTGLRRKIVESKSIANQGIWLSIKSAVLIGLFFGLWAGLFTWLSRAGLVGLLIGLLGALWFGALDVLQHYILRLILVIQGYAPSNYAQFLDYAVDRLFLQKVGGGYRFIHRLLLEHFADMHKTSPQKIN